MKHLRVLRNFLERHFPATVQDESVCTCGAKNHVRLFFFRVHGPPAAALVPEGHAVSAAQLREALAAGQVEPLTDAELEAICVGSELRPTELSENPFGSAVYVDESLAGCAELVFCPRMFFGQRGECFRAPIEKFLVLTHALVLPLTSACVAESDPWAV